MSGSWPAPGRSLNDFGGDWETYVEACYAQYRRDFYNGGTRPWPVDGQDLRIKKLPEDERGWCNTFWHLVTEGAIEDERIPVLSRLERINWPVQILREFNQTYPARESAKICWWMNDRGTGKGRYVLALTDFSYVVVVADRGKFSLLWTAYPVEFTNRRNRLRREFDEYWSRVDRNRND
jgi:hypothetical protein